MSSFNTGYVIFCCYLENYLEKPCILNCTTRFLSSNFICLYIAVVVKVNHCCCYVRPVIEAWKRKGSKYYWIKKQLDSFCIHPALFRLFNIAQVKLLLKRSIQLSVFWVSFNYTVFVLPIRPFLRLKWHLNQKVTNTTKKLP